MKFNIRNIFSGTRLRVFLALLVAFAVVKLATPAVFIGETPRVKRTLYAGILDIPNKIALLPVRLKSDYAKLKLFRNKSERIAIDSFSNVKQVENLPQNAVIKSISKGVSAAENPETGEKYIIINKGTKYRVVGYMIVNGMKMPKVEFIRE